jgi:hypothetical protein
MTRNSARCIPISIVLLAQALIASIVPVPGSLNITDLYAKSALVCSGRVLAVSTSKDERIDMNGVTVTRRTRVAEVRVERTYKGNEQALISVEFETFDNPNVNQYPLIPGTQVTLFLNRAGADYFVYADQYFGRFYASELREEVPATRSLTQLERDLEAGLRDPKTEKARINIQMLAGFEKLESTKRDQGGWPAHPINRGQASGIYQGHCRGVRHALGSKAWATVEFAQIILESRLRV